MQTRTAASTSAALAAAAAGSAPTTCSLSALPGAVRLRAVDRALHADPARRPTVLTAQFDADETLRADRAPTGHRARLREHPVHHDAQLAGRGRASTCRRCGCMFTGGEAVPYERAAEFEDRTGAAVLQFFGSNETGPCPRTRVDRRPSSSGCAPPGRSSTRCGCGCSPTDGTDVTAAGGPGQAAVRGPGHMPGLLRRPGRNEKLFTPGRLDAHRRHLHHRRRRLPAGGGPDVRLHHPRRQEHQRRRRSRSRSARTRAVAHGGRGRRCPTRCSASGSAPTW